MPRSARRAFYFPHDPFPLTLHLDDPWGNPTLIADGRALRLLTPLPVPLFPALPLYYLQARYYDPSTFRFLTKDPDGGDKDDPLSQNPYVYAKGNPVKYVDHNGNDFFGALGVGVGMAGAVILAVATSEAWLTAGAVLLGASAVYGIARPLYGYATRRMSGGIAAAGIAASFAGYMSFGSMSMAYELIGPDGWLYRKKVKMRRRFRPKRRFRIMPRPGSGGLGR